MSVCEPLMPDVLAPKGGYTENPEKPQNRQNWGVGVCVGMGACLGQYAMYVCTLYMCTVDQEIFMLKLIA